MRIAPLGHEGGQHTDGHRDALAVPDHGRGEGPFLAIRQHDAMVVVGRDLDAFASDDDGEGTTIVMLVGVFPVAAGLVARGDFIVGDDRCRRWRLGGQGVLGHGLVAKGMLAQAAQDLPGLTLAIVLAIVLVLILVLVLELVLGYVAVVDELVQFGGKPVMGIVLDDADRLLWQRRRRQHGLLHRRRRLLRDRVPGRVLAAFAAFALVEEAEDSVREAVPLGADSLRPVLDVALDNGWVVVLLLVVLVLLHLPLSWERRRQRGLRRRHAHQEPRGLQGRHHHAAFGAVGADRRADGHVVAG